MGNATKVAAIAVGDIYLSYDGNKTLVLRNSLYVPTFRKNLISVSKLYMDILFLFITTLSLKEIEYPSKNNLETEIKFFLNVGT